MNCIHYLPLPSPLPSSHKLYTHLQVPIYYKPSSIHHQLLLRGNGTSVSRALPSQCTFLAAVKLTDTGKTSVLLQTGVLCLLAYWVANFLVPAMIFKNVQTNRESNEEDDDDESSDEDE